MKLDLVVTTSPSLVTIGFVSRYGEQGSPIDNFPEATKARFSSLIAFGVGRAGVEISPPGSFFFCLHFLVGGRDVKHSNATTSKPSCLVKSLTLDHHFCLEY